MRAPLLTLAALVAMSISMTVVCAGYGVVTVGVPYPEPTPAQAANERYHLEVCNWLMLMAGLSWLVTVGAAATVMVW